MRFCRDSLWDLNTTWNTLEPDFTHCFHQTLLVYVPCGLLWFLAPLEIYWIRGSQNSNIPWSTFNRAKCVSIGICILLDLISWSLTLSSCDYGSSSTSRSDLLAPLVLFQTHILALVLTWLNKKHGLTSSGVLFSFWITLCITSGTTLRSVLQFGPFQTRASFWSVEQSVIHMIYFPVVMGTTILHFWADPPPVYGKIDAHLSEPSPELGASFPSLLVFDWLSELIQLGERTPLNHSHIYDLKPDFTTKSIGNKWKRHTIYLQSKPGQLKVDLIRTLVRCFGPTYLFATFLQIIGLLISQTIPRIVSLLINFVSSSEPMWKGYFYIILLVVINVMRTILSTHYTYQYFAVGHKLRTALVSAIYNKTFSLSDGSRKHRSVGEMVNLMSIDTEKLNMLMNSLNSFWYTPFVIVLSLYFLWGYLGPSCLAGLAVMLILVPINLWLSSRIKHYQHFNMKTKDSRLDLMNEILDGVRILKLFAWEGIFQRRVIEARKTEMETLKGISYLSGVQAFLFDSAVFLVTLVTFGTYLYVDPSHTLNAEKAFVSIAYFNLMRQPMNQLPVAITQFIHASVAQRRLDAYLNADESDEIASQSYLDDKYAVQVEDGSFAWHSALDQPTIQGLNVKIGKGLLVAVVGQVGSGKSSLISAILGDMEKRSGQVSVHGSIGFVAQEPWIQNETVQDNILFGSQFNSDIYQRTLFACALTEDLANLEQGDQTEIGEKGINLSGGQKQRVSLARTVYSDKDIYLLDDPLSAVDAHVGKHIFQHVISNRTGLLKDKTRILVTHNLTFLPETDLILVMKNGSVSEMGTFNELMLSDGEFSTFFMEYANLSPNPERPATNIVESNESSGTICPIEEVVPKTMVLMAEKGSKVNIKRESEKGRTIVPEKLKKHSVSKFVYIYYAKAVGLSLSSGLLALYIVHQALSIGTNIWLARWSEDPNSGKQHLRDMYLGVYGGLGGASAMIIMIAYFIITIGGLNASTQLHNSILSRIMYAPMAFFDTVPKGRILNRFGTDIDAVDTSVPSNFNGLLQLLFNTLGTMVIICSANPALVLVFIPIFLTYWSIQRRYIASSRQLKRLISIAKSPIYSIFGETITGALTIKAFNLQDNFVRGFETKLDRLQSTIYLSRACNRWLGVRLEMLGNTVILFAALLAVFQRDKAHPGEVGLSLSYATHITFFLTYLIRSICTIENNMVSVERIQEYQDDVDQEAVYNSTIDETTKGDWPQQGAIRFQDLTTRYRPELDLVLKGITCNIHPREKIGIVGRTGAGKSSLMMALFRMIEPASGTIFIDGVDIAHLGLRFLRSHITVLPQEPVLFSGSIRFNLDPSGKFTEFDIWQALERGHLSDLVSQLKDGLNEQIRGGGTNFSVGQRQLLCLSRALLHQTKVLILDEATAAVDLDTDDLIQNTIKAHFGDSTILIIAHRLHTIMNCDRVMVLSQGRIEEMDSPQSLLANSKSVFQSMARSAGLL